MVISDKRPSKFARYVTTDSDSGGAQLELFSTKGPRHYVIFGVRHDGATIHRSLSGLFGHEEDVTDTWW